MTLRGEHRDLLWLVEALNSGRKENDRLRELVTNLNEISYGEIDRGIAGKVNDVFRGIRWSPCLHERNGNLSVIWLAREGNTIFQEEAGRVANLAALGLLVRVHQCPRSSCGRWFAAKREATPYNFKRPCSENCRIAIHRQKPRVKKKRAAYFREYYRDNLSSLKRQAKEPKSRR